MLPVATLAPHKGIWVRVPPIAAAIQWRALFLFVTSRFQPENTYMLRIECEAPTQSVCECCKNTTIRLTRFVYQDDSAFAVYYVQFTAGHSEKRLSGIIGLGEWGDDDKGPEARLAFPFQVWREADNFVVGLVDRVDSHWSEVTFLGHILDRKEALAHEWIDDVFHITDHMLAEDQEVVNFFS
jgi:hypothetical protein